MNPSDASSTQSQNLKVKKFQVPVDHILVAEKWNDTPLGKLLKAHCNAIFTDGLGCVDFQTSNTTAIVYLNELEVLGQKYKRKLLKLLQADGIRGIVIADRTTITAPMFKELQQCVTIEIGLPLIPVDEQSQLPQLLAQMVVVDGRSNSNPFRIRKKKTEAEVQKQVINCLKCIPSLGTKKAELLVEQYKTIYKLSKVEESRLALVIGKQSAAAVVNFFKGNSSDKQF